MSNATGIAKGITNVQSYQFDQAVADYKDKIYPIKFQLNAAETGFSKNQGAIAECVGCATSQVIEALLLRDVLSKNDGEEIKDEILNKENFGYEEISESYIYGKCRDAGSKYLGMIPQECFAKLKSIGAVPKQYFNIVKEMPEIQDIANKHYELDEMARLYAIESYLILPNDFKNRDLAIKYILTEYRIPVVAVYGQGFGERHCVLIVGWNDEKNTYRIKNSWGTDWGNNGYCSKYKTDLEEAYMLINEETKLPFEDVNEDDWYYNAIKHAYLSNIMQGRTDTEFEPNETMTRAEMATVVSRVLKAVDERVAKMNELLNK